MGGMRLPRFWFFKYMNYICVVKLTLKVKLLPDKNQSKALIETIERFNQACCYISEQAFKEKKYNQVKLHHVVYYKVREVFNLPAQLTVRAISKVVDSYKLDKKTQRQFRLMGAITYDSRLLTYKGDNVSICTLDGREKMPFVCHRPDWLPYIKGEADLIYKKGKFYILQTVEFPEEKVKDMDEFLGVDMGVVDIAVLSTGENISSKWINEYRVKREKIRSSIQRKGTKGAKKLLKRLSGREKNTATLINHTLSKRIVKQAKEQNKGVAVEDLTHIRKRTEKKVRRKQRGLRSRWSFYQLRSFIDYKCAMQGVPFVAVPPAYTSKTCSCCNHIGLRVGKSFTCKNCGLVDDADINAAINISTWGRTINRPEESNMYCSNALHGQV
jgi:IS605 OrfB family transposase